MQFKSSEIKPGAGCLPPALYSSSKLCLDCWTAGHMLVNEDKADKWNWKWGPRGQQCWIVLQKSPKFWEVSPTKWHTDQLIFMSNVATTCCACRRRPIFALDWRFLSTVRASVSLINALFHFALYFFFFFGQLHCLCRSRKSWCKFIMLRLFRNFPPTLNSITNGFLAIQSLLNYLKKINTRQTFHISTRAKEPFVRMCVCSMREHLATIIHSSEKFSYCQNFEPFLK